MTREEQLADSAMWLAQTITQAALANAKRRAESGYGQHDAPLVKLTGTAQLRIDGVRHVATVSVESKQF